MAMEVLVCWVPYQNAGCINLRILGDEVWVTGGFLEIFHPLQNPSALPGAEGSSQQICSVVVHETEALVSVLKVPTHVLAPVRPGRP